MGDDARPEIAAGAGKDIGDDGVVDVDVESGLSLHGCSFHSFKCNDTYLRGGTAT
jgi:hypothetical protein